MKFDLLSQCHFSIIVINFSLFMSGSSDKSHFVHSGCPNYS